MTEPFFTLRLDDDGVRLLDQRCLPEAERYLLLRSAEEVARAIEDMAVRGAPAIGVAAAMGVAVELARSSDAEVEAGLERACQRLGATRPTAVNLSWALTRVRERLAARIKAGADPETLRREARELAQALHAEDIATCRAIGEHGAALVPERARLLTHCNAGGLATAGYGTALGVVRSAARAGRIERVLASETRPFLQGARLTTWELDRDGIPVTVITDSMPGSLMRAGEIDLVVCRGTCFVFVEVKTSRRRRRPEERVNAAKQRRIARAAAQYIERFVAGDEARVGAEFRFDVVAVDLSRATPHIEHIEDAFDAPIR